MNHVLGVGALLNFPRPERGDIGRLCKRAASALAIDESIDEGKTWPRGIKLVEWSMLRRSTPIENLANRFLESDLGYLLCVSVGTTGISWYLTV